MKRRWSRAILIATVAGFCIGCDQVTKVVAQRALADSEPLFFFGDMVRLSCTENAGAFLGLGAGLPSEVRMWVLGVMVAFVLVLAAARVIADHSAGALRVVGMAMIVGGGVGNLIDRAGDGVVTDFINMGIGSLRTGVFNIADVAITAGALVVLCSLRGRGGDAGPSDALTRRG